MENEREIPRLIKISTADESLIKQKEVRKKHLVNKLNYVNFQDDTILINFKHTKYDHTVSHRAKPLPCLGDKLECIWVEPDKLRQQLKSYKFQNILVPDGQKLFLIKSDEIIIDDKGISLFLPETCDEVRHRKLGRHLCKEIKAQLIQNSAIFYGVLIDFSAVSLRVEVTAEPPQTFQWMDSESTVSLNLSDEHGMLYSGECRILKQSGGQKTRNYVIKPLSQQIQRFKPKEFRSTRQKLVPSPNIIFRHPFTKIIINLKVVDLSGSGFAVEEDKDSAVLLPGMIIPELELNFANSFKIECKAQVVHRKIVSDEENGDWVKCGLALLDMDIEDHNRFLALLHQAKDGNSYICSNVNLDDLWNFFFESGFIYPKKYAFLQTNKEKIKETYKKLYTQNPQIARHFIYQNKGRILGHLSMVRFYDNTWMIQHHAAERSASSRAGVAVLDQVGRFSNAAHNLYSIHMDFLICYFRPENKFPNRIFGGVYENIKNPKGCSLDMFAYFYCRKTLNEELDLGEPWSLLKTQPEDLLELKCFYEHLSDGLMLKALDLEPGSDDIDELSKKYQRLGFKRERHLFSLKKDDSLKAVVLVNISDIGLNLADLINNIQVIVIDSDDLPKEIFHLMLSKLSTKFEQNEIPVLLYPVSFADKYSIPYEKLYSLWILDTQYGDHYYRYIKKLLKGINS